MHSQLSALQGLLILAGELTAQRDERHIVELVASAVGALGPCWLEGISLDGEWQNRGSIGDPWGPAVWAQLERVVLSAGGPVGLVRRPWSWAFPLPGPAGPMGHLVVAASRAPSANEAFLLEALAQHAGAALTNARLHARERAQADELRRANEALRQSMAIHQRLTVVAAAGEGQEGIARALHDLTGYPVGIEDRHGNLMAWAGPGRPEPYPKSSPTEREQVLASLEGVARPIRLGPRLASLARPAPHIVGLVYLQDPQERALEPERMALEYATTVLSLELTRLHNQAQDDRRLRAELVVELIAGTSGPGALKRAQALDYDLGRPHWVMFVEGSHGTGDLDAFAEVVRRASRDCGIGSLQVSRPGGVVMLAESDASLEEFRSRVVTELHGGACRIGVGGRCELPEDYPRSLREAEQAIKVQKSTGQAARVTVFRDLGIYQLLSEVPDPADVERLVRRWLGSLLDYDQRTGSQLVGTLSSYLESGGKYDRTAAALFVHRSTLKYRLSRIKEISGLDLSSPDVLFNLQLATRAWHTLKALRDV